ncbi:MAG TPA: ATP-binding protein [Oculatellaceae cyanobacterium]|jgi:signal transduction histidine kinase
MKISAKFIGSSIGVVGLIASLAFGSEFLLWKAENQAALSREKAAKSVDNTLQLEVLLRDQVMALKDFLMLNRDPLDMAKYQKATSEFKLTLNELQRLMPDNTELAVISRQHKFLNRLSNELSDTPSTPEQFYQDFKAISSFGKSIDFSLNALAINIRSQDKLASEQANRSKQTAQLARHIIIGIIIIVFFGQFWLILLPVIKSIKKLQLGANKIATGDLDYRLNIQTGDEIQELSQQFNQMSAALRESYRTLEEKVIARTIELTNTNEILAIEIEQRKQIEEILRQSEAQLRQQAQELEQALTELQQTQSQLIQTEKMSSLGQMVAGVAHEINNPVNFIHGNITHANEYIQDILELLHLYQEHYPNPVAEVADHYQAIDLEFLIDDLPKVIASMRIGTERIRDIVLSLRNFSRLDEADMKAVDIHEGIDSTLLILQNRLKARPNHSEIKIVKQYDSLPQVTCYAGQLNQVFMNILNNAIDALDEYNSQRSTEEIKSNPSQIIISTQLENDYINIKIVDNGSGMTEEVKKQLFDPFFTTKPVGKGTGLGLSICYQIIQKHQGIILCESELGKGTQFSIQIPIVQQGLSRVVNSQANNLALETVGVN